MTEPAEFGRPASRNAAVTAFKADLNEYRQQHPKSGFGALAETLEDGKYGKDAIVSSTTLNDATNPLKPLPTARTVNAMILALTGGNTQTARDWVARRDRADRAPDTATPAAGIIGRPPESPAATHSGGRRDELAKQSPPPESNRGRRTALWVVAALVVLVGSNALTYSLARQTRDAAPPQKVQTGDNPVNTICIKDAKVAGSRSTPAFLLEMLFSVKCDAAWGRITRNDDADLGNEVRVTIYRRNDPNGPTRQEAIEPDAHSAFTTLIVRADPTDRLCVTGEVTTDSRTDTTTRPLCL